MLQRVHKAYDNFHSNNPAIPTRYLKETLTLIVNENYFQFNGRNYLQIHGTAMGTKMAVAFANIFMADIETQIDSQSVAVKSTVWKRYIDDIFPLWDTCLVIYTIKNGSSNKQIHIIQQSNLWLKSQILRLHFWIKLYTKAIDSITIRYWILKRIPSRLKPFVNTRIFPLATHQESKKDLLKVKPQDSYEQMPQKQHLRKILKSLNHDSLLEATQTPRQILPFVTISTLVLNLKHVLMGK